MLRTGVKREFIREDRQSGKDFERVAYQYLKTELRAGDTLVVKELDRLGRDYDGIKREWRELTDKGIHIVVIDTPILDTRKDGMEKLVANIVFELLSYIAASERDKIRQRQAEGIAIAKAKGKHLGRPIVQEPPNFKSVYEKWRAGEYTAVQSMNLLSLAKSTFYRLAKKYSE